MMTTPKSEPSRNQFGTFAGVFTPSILTILGVIMFLRAGYVVGEAGIRGAVVILAVSTLVTFLTSFSISTVATNTPVTGGGAYFLISRALGPQFGGAIGLALFFAQALSVPFYLLGFVQALVQTFPDLAPYFTLFTIGTAVVLFSINYFGASWAIKTQYFVMAVLAVAILAFLGGALWHFDPQQFVANWEPGYTSRAVGFWVVFAVYFPAVTGILAGVNMSGDLKDPSRSLVRGTLYAVLVGSTIYLAQILLCGGSQSREQLIGRPYQTLLENALFGAGFLVVAGVFAATLSSALGSLLGAPRVLQAFARDRILPGLSWLGHGTRKGDEPRIALWLTFFITLFVLHMSGGEGSLASFDVVASIITMFFLCTYGMINLAAFVELFGANPSFRPRFRYYHWSLSLFGALLCFGIMIVINLVAALTSLAVIAALYVLISRRVYRWASGDARRGFIYSLVVRNLFRLRTLTPHPKNWRPTFLVLSGNPRSRLTLARYGVWLEARRGLVTTAEILLGDMAALADKRRESLAAMEQFLRENDLNALPEVVVAENLDEGIRLLVQAHSIGPLKPNTVLLGWPQESPRIGPFVRHLKDIRALDKNIVCVVDHGLPPDTRDKRRIDVWWRDEKNASLMVILAYLLTRNWEWSRAAIRILRHVASEEEASGARAAMGVLAKAARIEIEVSIVVSMDSFEHVVKAHSADADVVLIGFHPPSEAEALDFYQEFDALLRELPTSILVSSTGEADLLA